MWIYTRFECIFTANISAGQVKGTCPMTCLRVLKAPSSDVYMPPIVRKGDQGDWSNVSEMVSKRDMPENTWWPAEKFSKRPAEMSRCPCEYATRETDQTSRKRQIKGTCQLTCQKCPKRPAVISRCRQLCRKATRETDQTSRKGQVKGAYPNIPDDLLKITQSAQMPQCEKAIIDQCEKAIMETDQTSRKGQIKGTYRKLPYVVPKCVRMEKQSSLMAKILCLFIRHRSLCFISGWGFKYISSSKKGSD
jgi:hypothetical protein